MKFCEDCQHKLLLADMCTRPVSTNRIDYVTDNEGVTSRNVPCREERKRPWFLNRQKCGPEGKYFKKKTGQRPKAPPPPPLPPVRKV